MAFCTTARAVALVAILVGLFGLFGLGRERTLSLADHLRNGYKGAIAQAGLAGQAVPAATVPLVAQPPQAVQPISGMLPTA